MQRLSEQPLVGEERYVTTLITAAKETNCIAVTSLMIPPAKSFNPKVASCFAVH